VREQAKPRLGQEKRIRPDDVARAADAITRVLRAAGTGM